MLSISVFGLALAAGAAIDIGHIVSLRTDAQALVDEAVLAAVHGPSGAETKTAQQYLSQNGGNITIASLDTNLTTNQITVSAQADLAMPPSFMDFTGLIPKTISVYATATAPLMVSGLDVNVVAAYGWDEKIMTVKTKDASGAVTTVLSARYVLTDPNGAGMRGTGITTFTPGNTISVGAVTDLWFELEDIENPAGTHHLYSTEDPATASHLWVDGKQSPVGQTTNYRSLLSCGQTVSHAWEDSVYTYNWADQDIFFSVTATCSKDPNAEVRLTQ